MYRHRVRGLAVAVILSWAILPGASQTPALRILSASPSGELNQLADADQIRIVFSEPMVPLGSARAGPAPHWIRMTPAAAGSFFWSGTQDSDLLARLVGSAAVRDPLHRAGRWLGHERGRPRAGRAVRAHVHDTDGPAALR